MVSSHLFLEALFHKAKYLFLRTFEEASSNRCQPMMRVQGVTRQNFRTRCAIKLGAMLMTKMLTVVHDVFSKPEGLVHLSRKLIPNSIYEME